MDDVLTTHPLRPRRWVGLDANDRIIGFGRTRGRFERQCLAFDNGTYALWERDGMRYAEILSPFKDVRKGDPLHHYAHRRIRQSSDRLFTRGDRRP